ncbi:MAG: isoprenoid biosynthesis glyoxalase ElbB [Desulfatitalea sp.]|nr:isoprenoid biosynthesis glyoxalase ElbB [Desulfatitalea sp.]
MCIESERDRLPGHVHLFHPGKSCTGPSSIIFTSKAVRVLDQGDIVDLATVSAKQIDALIIPGGFGAAKNLSDFAIKGPDAKVHPQVQRLLDEMIAARKPIGALCIAPATVARALSAHRPEVTIGTDMGTAAAIETMGAKHVACKVDAIHVDTARKIVTTPAYMLGPSIRHVAVGIEKLVKKVIELA